MNYVVIGYWNCRKQGVRSEKMGLENLVEEAIKRAVAEEEQKDTLAVKIYSWVSALASGNERQDDSDSAHNRVRLLYDDVDLADEEEEE